MNFQFPLRFGAALLLALTFSLTGCKKEAVDYAPVDVPAANLVGAYQVKKFLPTESFTFNIARHNSEANTLLISNLLAILPAPIEAKASGNTLQIDYTYVNPSGNSLTIKGQGTLTGDVLKIQYHLSGILGHVYEVEGQKVKVEKR